MKSIEKTKAIKKLQKRNAFLYSKMEQLTNALSKVKTPSQSVNISCKILKIYMEASANNFNIRIIQSQPLKPLGLDVIEVKLNMANA